MSDSLRLSVPDLADDRAAAAFYGVADAAVDVDGEDPFDDQARFDVAAGRRTPIVATVWSEDEHGRAIGAAIVGRGAIDLVIDPLFRGKGFGAVAFAGLVPTVQGEVTAWSHGAHPAARILAERHGFHAARTLLELALDPLGAPESPPAADGVTVSRFDAERDAAAWVELNARVFAGHPEQGAVDSEALADRMAEPWFDSGDFLVAHDHEGRMVGYDWLKIEPASTTGEIYVLGVDAASGGHGVGRLLLAAGLARMAQRGCTRATLYVEGDNARALRLYRAAGFVDAKVDVQYRRAAEADPSA